jgi:glycopeptide antibiotics resistance protein
VSAPAARESLSDDEVVGQGTARVATESVYIAPVDEGLRASRMLIVKVLSRVLFTLYLLTLLWLVLFKISYDMSAILADYQMRSLNLIPFVTWGQTGVSETVSNLITFIPFGLLLGMNFKSAATWRLLLIVFGFSAVVETLQFVLAIGTTDITDVVTNTIGGLVGLVVYRLASKFISAKILDGVITVIGLILFVVFLLLRGLVLQVRY